MYIPPELPAYQQTLVKQLGPLADQVWIELCDYTDVRLGKPFKLSQVIPQIGTLAHRVPRDQVSMLRAVLTCVLLQKEEPAQIKRLSSAFWEL